MSTDLATLGIKIDSSDANKADDALNKLADTGGKAEASTKKVTGASAALKAELGQLIAALRENTNATNADANAAGKNKSAIDAMTAAINAGVKSIKDSAAALMSHKTASEQAEDQNRKTGNSADDLAARVAKLKASVQPFASAQDRANAELAEAKALFDAGAISAGDYAQAQLMLTTRATAMAEKQEIANQRLASGGKAAKLTASEALNLSRQFADVGVSAAMGMNPFMILIQQGPQIADIMKTSGLGVRGLVV